jgi:CheY-like chemotaxis protein
MNGHVAVRLERERDHAQIVVTDTGIGISPEFLPHIFERFRQADTSLTMKHGGLGLGLAIVRHLVEMHGGTVQAHSDGRGFGATFTVRLPLASTYSAKLSLISSQLSAASYSEAEAADALLLLRGLRILIVDDDADSLDMLKAVFERYEADVSVAPAADEALAILLRRKPDLVISDIAMPEADGYSLIRKIRSLQPEQGGSVPAIALTAYARPEDASLALSAGFQKHLAKPINPPELLSAVTEILRARAL